MGGQWKSPTDSHHSSLCIPRELDGTSISSYKQIVSPFHENDSNQCISHNGATWE